MKKTEVYKAWSCPNCDRLREPEGWCGYCQEQATETYRGVEAQEHVCELTEFDPETMEEVEP
jgi:hypothetical protein